MWVIMATRPGDFLFSEVVRGNGMGNYSENKFQQLCMCLTYLRHTVQMHPLVYW